MYTVSSAHQRLYTTYGSGEVGGDEPPHLDLYTMHTVPHALLIVGGDLLHVEVPQCLLEQSLHVSFKVLQVLHVCRL